VPEIRRVVRTVPTIDQHTGERQSLFLYLASQAPHAAPYRGAPQRHVQRAESYRGEDPKRKEVAALVSCLDELVGTLEDELKSQPDVDGSTMWDRTVLVFSSDNGPGRGSGASGAPFRGFKTQVWEGGVHSVAFARFPPSLGGRAGSYDSPVHVVDWMPTFSSLAGIPSRMISSDGVDLSPVLQQPQGALQLLRKAWWHRGSDSLLLTVDQVLRCGSVRDVPTGLKMVLNGDCSTKGPPDVDEWQLFDVVKDPSESVDLMSAGGMPMAAAQVASRLRAVLESEMQGAAAPLAFETPGDPRAAPSLNGGRWLNWLDALTAVQ